ncbi:MAG: hypothetical protein EON59_06795 [Alphaproteobacteria bacterium]|nr:MAG: hypothetical protein EON59_06795 [Alphaproteobacteria bacterium]
MDKEAEAFRQAAAAKATYDNVKGWRSLAEGWQPEGTHGVSIGWNTGRQTDGYYEITTEVEKMIEAELAALVRRAVDQIEARCAAVIEGLNT